MGIFSCTSGIIIVNLCTLVVTCQCVEGVLRTMYNEALCSLSLDNQWSGCGVNTDQLSHNPPPAPLWVMCMGPTTSICTSARLCRWPSGRPSALESCSATPGPALLRTAHRTAAMWPGQGLLLGYSWASTATYST